MSMKFIIYILQELTAYEKNPPEKQISWTITERRQSSHRSMIIHGCIF